MRGFKLSVVVTRENVGQLDAFKAIADRYGAQLRLTRLRPSGRGADVWDELHPTPRPAARALRLAARARRGGADRRLVLPPRARYGDALPGLNLCGAGPRRVPDRPDRRRLRLPVRDPRRVPGRQRPRAAAASRACGASPSCSCELREPQTGGACGSCCALRLLPRRLHGGEVLHRPAARRARPGVRARPRRGAAGRARRGRRCRSRRVDHSRAQRRPRAPATRARSPTSTCSRTSAEMASTRDWFESVAEAQRRAKRRLPQLGLRRADRRRRARADAATTTSPRSASSGSCRASPPGCRARASWRRPCSGQEISLPVMISPTGVQAVHPDGEVAVARAAAAARHRDGPELVREQADRGGRRGQPADVLPGVLAGLARADRCRSSTAPRRPAPTGLIVTLDWSFSHRRDWGSPAIPERLDLQDDGASSRRRSLARPRWLRDFAARRRAARPRACRTWRRRAASADVLRRLRRVDADAAADLGRTSPGCASSGTGRSCSRASCASTTRARAVDAGADAISVSNHGGNNLDGTPASIRALPGDRRGGRRRGRGPARRRHPPRQRRRQGARARRPRGDDRPRRTCGAWRPTARRASRTCSTSCAAGIDETLNAIDVASVGDLTPHDLVVPPGFARTPNHQSGSWLPAEA